MAVRTQKAMNINRRDAKAQRIILASLRLGGEMSTVRQLADYHKK